MAAGRAYPIKRGNIMLIRFVLACVLAASIAMAQSGADPAVEYARRIVASEKTYRPAAGYVPDSKRAVAIATAVLIPIYGKDIIDAERPWHTGLKDGVWTVVGTFNGNGDGGEAIIQLDKRTGVVVFVSHTM
jgi:hypothetical protein